MVACYLELFRSQSNYGILACGEHGGKQTCYHGKRYAYKDEQISVPRQERVELRNVRKCMDDNVDGYTENYGYQNSDNTRGKSHDEGLGVEYSGDILLGCTDGSENTDLLGSFKNGDIGDYSYHY